MVIYYFLTVPIQIGLGPIHLKMHQAVGLVLYAVNTYLDLFDMKFTLLDHVIILFVTCAQSKCVCYVNNTTVLFAVRICLRYVHGDCVSKYFLPVLRLFVFDMASLVSSHVSSFISFAPYELRVEKERE